MIEAGLMFLFLVSVEGATVKVANIDYVSRGYDIFLGDPMAKDIDPGIKTQSIFEQTYKQKKSSNDNKWILPDSVGVNFFQSCSQEAKFSKVTGETSFQETESFAVEVDAKGTYEGITASFSAGASFQDISKQVYKDKQIIFTMSAKCSVYTAENNKYPLTSDFQREINKLPTTGSNAQADYHKFYEKFGTHYISAATFGSAYLRGFKSSMESYSQMLSSKINVQSGVEGSFLELFKLSVNSNASVDTTSTKEVQKYITESYIATKGSRPPGDGKWTTWAQNSGKSPVPNKMTVKQISTLLTTDNFKGANPTVLKTKQKLLDKYFVTYCTVYLKKKMKNCRSAQPDQPLPLPSVCETEAFTKSTAGEKVCFFKLQKSMTWNDANKNCKIKGARLPIIRDNNDNELIKNFTVQHNNKWDGLWLDLTRQGHGDNYVFSSDQTPATDYEPWAEGQPNRGDEECVGMLTDGSWNDYKCNNNKGGDGTPTMTTLCEFVIPSEKFR